MTSPQPTEIKRKTNETDIRLKLLLSGERKVQVETGIGFFDHLLQTLAFWAGWDLELSCTGDLQVDTHHTVEDVALALGFHQGQGGYQRHRALRDGLGTHE